MAEFRIIPQTSQLARVGIRGVPALFLDAGEKAWWRFVEFFTANIRNKNTREAYARAALRFSAWCTEKKIELHQVNPFLIAAYIEELGTVLARPSVKQHLAAIRMLFDFLVVGQIVPMNPAASVRGPTHIVKRGRTPVLSAEEARSLFNSIDVTTIGGMRDRALIAVMVFSFARIGAVVAMNGEDYFQQGRRMWFRLHEKGGKLHAVPAHHVAEKYVDAYVNVSGIVGRKGVPLFCTLDRRRNLTKTRMDRREALAMIKRRARAAGIPDSTCCHSFRATGITTYLLNGGTLEKAQQIANHQSSSTTKLYDRTNDEVSLDEIERIVI
jgi:integrase/recombinase XerD